MQPLDERTHLCTKFFAMHHRREARWYFDLMGALLFLSLANGFRHRYSPRTHSRRALHEARLRPKAAVIQTRHLRWNDALGLFPPTLRTRQYDQLIHSFVEETFSDAGMEMVIVSLGARAVELLDASDVKYPSACYRYQPWRRNGWEVVRHARELDPGFSCSM